MRLTALILYFAIQTILVPMVCADNSSSEPATRINRPVNSESHFKAFVPGVSIRWWRNFRNPSVCPYVMCGGSCSDISGIPRLGAYTQDQLMSDTTPCSLNPQNVDVASGGCCMSRNINSAYSSACSDEQCSNSLSQPGTMSGDKQ